MSAERVTAFKKLRAVPNSERVMGANQDSEERMVIPEKLPMFIKRRKRQAPAAPVAPTLATPVPAVPAVPTGSTAAPVPANPAPAAINATTGINRFTFNLIQFFGFQPFLIRMDSSLC